MNRWHLAQAARALRRGGIVLHAAEGVWGLACDPFNAVAVRRLLSLKQRPIAKGLIVIAAEPSVFSAELSKVDATARRAVLESWPGAVTWLLPNATFPGWITGGRRQVAVRVPGHPQARALAAAFGGALVSTSANRSGHPAPTRAIIARRQFRPRRRWTDRRVPGRDFPRQCDYILPGEVLVPGAPSQIRTVSGVVLRP